MVFKLTNLSYRWRGATGRSPSRSTALGASILQTGKVQDLKSSSVPLVRRANIDDQQMPENISDFCG
jgi:hypothetical protein